MTRRIRIPLLLDLLIVDDPAHIAALDAHPAVGRSFSRSTSRLGRWLGGRLGRLLSVGNTPYPALLPREDKIREAQTTMLQARLGAHGDGVAIPVETLRLLGRYVRGEMAEAAILAPLQQMIGGQLVSDYRATEGTVADALLLGGAARNPLRGLWLWLTRRLGPMQRRISKACDGDIYAAHGTVVGFQSLLIELRKLRAHFAETGGVDGRGAEAVVAGLIAPPPRTLRAAVGEIDAPFLQTPAGPGTLIILAPAAKGPEATFALGRWSQCPAHGLVTRLLEESWSAAISA